MRIKRTVTLVGLLFWSSLIGQNLNGLQPMEVIGNWSASYGRHFSAEASSRATNPSISSLFQTNPAAATNINSMCVGLSYQFRSPNEWVFSNGSLFNKDFRKTPNAFGIAVKTMGFNVAIGYNLASQLQVDDEIEVTTIEEPEGTGVSWELHEETHHNQYTLVLGKKLSLRRLQSSLHMGVSITSNHIHIYRRVWEDEIITTANANSAVIGLMFEYKEKLSVGTFYNFGFKTEFHKRDYLVPMLWNGSEFMFKATQHPMLSGGLSLLLGDRVVFIVDIDYSSWDGYQEVETSQLNYSLITQFSMSPKLELRVGILSNNFPKYKDGTRYHYDADFRRESIYPLVSASFEINERLKLSISGAGKVVDTRPLTDRDMLAISFEYTR